MDRILVLREITDNDIPILLWAEDAHLTIDFGYPLKPSIFKVVSITSSVPRMGFDEWY